MAIPFSGQRGSRNGLVLLASFLVAQACGGGGTDSGPPRPDPPPAITEISIPAETGDGWAAASHAEAGLAEQPLLAALNAIRQGAT